MNSSAIKTIGTAIGIVGTFSLLNQSPAHELQKNLATASLLSAVGFLNLGILHSVEISNTIRGIV